MSLASIRLLLRLAALSLLLLVAGSIATPRTAAGSPVWFTPDITAKLGTVLPDIVEDEDTARDDGAGSVNTIFNAMFASIPPNTAIAAFEISSSPAVGALLVLETTTALPGLPVVSPAAPNDVVSWNPNTSTFSVAFDGAANGIPAGTHIDALGVDSGGALLLSFDTTVLLPGAGVVDDEDIVRFAGGVYALLYDGSANGITPDLDLDALTLEPGSTKPSLSFDVSGGVPGLGFDDEDVVAFDLLGGTYAMVFDGSASDPVNWPGEDLVALPEPGLGTAMGSALVGLALLERRRAREHPVSG
jgi:hypothetical protein